MTGLAQPEVRRPLPSGGPRAKPEPVSGKTPMADATGSPAPILKADAVRPDPVPEMTAAQAPLNGSIDRSEQPGRVGLLLMLAGLLVGAAIGLSFVANEQAQALIVWLLALLAMAGVFFLFALAIGAIQLSGSSARDDITRGSSTRRRTAPWSSRMAAG